MALKLLGKAHSGFLIQRNIDGKTDMVFMVPISEKA
jgi:hypothetical protein